MKVFVIATYWSVVVSIDLWWRFEKIHYMDTITKISIFNKKEIRKTIHDNEWWFVIVDVIEALTDSIDPSGYLRDLRRRDLEIEKGWGQIAHPLSINTAGGPQKILCANTEGIFRIVQSIPSPKAEPNIYTCQSLESIIFQSKTAS